ncbi:MAG: hypothetical protein ACE145_21870 [Terriglobia bacterium]
MRTQGLRLITSFLMTVLFTALLAIPALGDYREVPAGTRFMVELRDKLDAKKVKPGKKFSASTLESLQLTDGTIVPAEAKLKGRVGYVEGKKMVLRFERIETRYGKYPIVANVVGVMGERDVKNEVGPEGEIKAEGGRGKSAAIGAVIGGGLGAAIGSQKGGKGTAIGAGAGGATGALVGAAAGGKHLVLQKGARLEVELERPLAITRGK